MWGLTQHNLSKSSPSIWRYATSWSTYKYTNPYTSFSMFNSPFHFFNIFLLFWGKKENARNSVLHSYLNFCTPVLLLSLFISLFIYLFYFYFFNFFFYFSAWVYTLTLQTSNQISPAMFHLQLSPFLLLPTLFPIGCSDLNSSQLSIISFQWNGQEVRRKYTRTPRSGFAETKTVNCFDVL